MGIISPHTQLGHIRRDNFKTLLQYRSLAFHPRGVTYNEGLSSLGEL